MMSDASLGARLGAAIGAELFTDFPMPEKLENAFAPLTQALAEFLLEELAGTDPANQRSALAALFPPENPSEPTSGAIADDLLIGRAARTFGKFLRDLLFAATPSAGSSGGGLAEPLKADVWTEQLRRVWAVSGHPEVFEALKASGILDVLSVKPGTLAGIVYSQEEVLRLLRSLARLLDDALHLAGDLVKALDEEIPRLLVRSATAETISLVADKVPFYVKSDPEIGRIVHKSLQDEYLSWLGPLHDIVVEQFDGKTAQLYVRFRGNPKGVPLDKVAGDRDRDPEAFYKALRGAMVSAKLPEESWLRADLVDADLREIWEIKPVASAVTGVWQEAFYRVSTNLILIGLHLQDGVSFPRNRLLRSGGFWPFLPNGGPELLLHPAIDVTKLAPRVAIPFQIELLDGLILYAVFRFRFRKRLEEAIRKFFKQIEKTVRAILKEAKEFADMLENLMRNIIRVVAVLIAVVVLVAVAAALAKLAAAGAVAGLEALAFAAGAAAIVIILLKAQGSKPTATSSVRIGPITVQGVPNDTLDTFLNEVSGRLDDLGDALTTKIERLAPLIV